MNVIVNRFVTLFAVIENTQGASAVLLVNSNSSEPNLTARKLYAGEPILGSVDIAGEEGRCNLFLDLRSARSRSIQWVLP